ncbi:expressed unknown protein [Seminavis robusta]|uniref:Calcineurin-like phosphoesterase domain-containing protein n=1 Tax=Seminavis robusta TaxID=568900 RepID=A0A9N8DCX8_9STRA|nr:expressed unknown protein [Seminavis robusta]|eukprot:Sro62_g035380.1 n/a (433) ;mRNA; f:66818-68116
MEDSDRFNSAELLQLADSIQRVFCLSDLHTDHPDNQKWLHEHMDHGNFNRDTDLIIVAGDISHDMTDTFVKSMSILTEHAQVLFVPGNHEAWIDRKHAPKSTSFDKLRQVYDVCEQMGVYTQSLLVGANSPHPLWIVPLESWYDGTLSFRESLCHDFQYWPWADFKRCVWEGYPPVEEDTDTELENPGQLPMGLVEHFLAKNEPLFLNNPFPNNIAVANTANNHKEPQSTGILTVSHFLPNVQSLPDWKDLDRAEFDDAWFDHGAGGMSAKFAKVAGSALLDDQIRRLLPSPTDDDLASNKKRNIHIFGHSHRPKDFVYEGIRYIHNPLGKPRERQLYMVSPQVDFQLVWDTQSTGEVPAVTTVIRLWEEQGGGLPALERRLASVKPRGRYNRFKGSRYNNAKTKTQQPKEQQVVEQQPQQPQANATTIPTE